jgi:hypothetical protein
MAANKLSRGLPAYMSTECNRVTAMVTYPDLQLAVCYAGIAYWSRM